MYHRSHGRFDITSGVYRQIWDFKSGQIPPEEQRRRLAPLVSWKLVEFDDVGIYLSREGMEIDFGGFGKEYACDRAAQMLRDLGLGSGLVNLSGDIVAIGPKPDGRPWEVGIQHPREASKLLAKVPLTDAAVATSGDYERFLERDGRRYSHILNPQTGLSVNYWQSVSVVADNCLTAGAIASIAMLLESEGSAWLEQTGLPYLALDLQGQLSTKNPQ